MAQNNSNDQPPMKEAGELIDALENPQVEEEATDIRQKDPFDILKSTLVSFFQNRLSTIEKEESFRKQVKDKLLEKVQEDEVSVPQLIQLLRGENKDITDAADSIFRMLRPTQDGHVSPFIEPSKKDDADDPFQDINASDQEKLHMLYRLVEEGYRMQKDKQNDNPSQNNE